MSLINIQIQPEDFNSQNDFYDDINIQLADDDHIEARCGEIFISHRKVLIFACTECKENFYNYDDFYVHLCEQHIPGEEEQKYKPTGCETASEESSQENLIVIMEHEEEEEEEEEDEDLKPTFITNSEQPDGPGFSQDLLDTFETMDDYEALEESETYKPEDYLQLFGNSEGKQSSTSIAKRSPIGKHTEPRKSVLKLKRSSSPAPDEFIDPLPSITPQFNCPHCPKTFKLEFDLKSHLKIHEANRKYKCEICGFPFTLLSNLRAHVRRHIGEKNYGCDECEKRFWTSTELNTHRRKHTGERPFICELCGSAFKTSGALTDHEKRHTQKKRHKCSECDRSFLHLQVLREHMNTHTLDRPFVCKLCKATFARKHSLTQHSSLHSAEKKYICEICSKDFAQLPGLLAHKKRHELD